MAKLLVLSGREVCQILAQHGFAEVRRRGSHKAALHAANLNRRADSVDLVNLARLIRTAFLFWFVLFNQTNKIDQINEIDQTDERGQTNDAAHAYRLS